MNRQTVFVHPAIQPYREELFRHLHDDLGVHLLFGTWYQHNVDYLSRMGLSNWSALRDRRLWPYQDGGVSAGIVREAATGSYDVWISSILHWFPTHATFPVVKARRKKFVLWTEDWWWPGGFKGLLARPYVRAILAGTDHFIVAGSRTRDFLIANGVPATRVTVAMNATTDLSKVTGYESRLPELAGRFRPAGPGLVYLYLNRIVEYKGLDVLLRAFRLVQQQTTGAQLIVAGDGPARAAAENLALELGLTAVHFVGAVDQKDAVCLYRLADVYVHPARFSTGRVRAEAWGFTVNEAMSMGKPVIATDAVAAAYDLVTEGKTGFLVKAGDVEGLAARMIELARDPSRAREMGLAARERMQQVTPHQQYLGFRSALESLGR